MLQETLANTYAVILAGGSGTRFWPSSRQNLPKQQLALTDSPLSMLELTLKRLDGFIPPERRVIVTHERQSERTRSLVGASCKHILSEPEAKNTAAALAMAALEIESFQTGQETLPATMISLHADHEINPTGALQESLVDAIRLARTEDALVLLGVTPTYPETGYGYIECGGSLTDKTQIQNAYEVVSFKEKPDHETAKSYLDKGTSFWNTGMFIWQTQTLLSELERHLPEVLGPLQSICHSTSSEPSASFASLCREKLKATYLSLPSIAIDHGVLEKSSKTALIKAQFDWQDVGSWAAMDKVHSVDAHGNVLSGDHVTIDTSNSVVQSSGPLVATVGVSDLVVVATKDSVLVCHKDRAQDVKQVVEHLKTSGRTELL